MLANASGRLDEVSELSRAGRVQHVVRELVCRHPWILRLDANAQPCVLLIPDCPLDALQAVVAPSAASRVSRSSCR